MYCWEFTAKRELVEPLESSVATMPGRGKRVNSTAQNIIFNVYKYFERESAKTKNRVPSKLMHKTTEATGYGERTVGRIVPEKFAMSGAAFSSPAKRYKIDRKKIMMNDFNTEALWHAVHEFYSEKKYVTMDSLLLVIKEKGIFNGECTTLWRVMRKMGFKYKKVNDKRYIYMRNPV